jgi:uncharacterized protein YbjT (DUF2867 family)
MYVVMGATGNVGHIVAERLLAADQAVRGIGRSEERLQPLAAIGLEPFICDAADRPQLTKAFAGATGAFVMIPPSMTSRDYRSQQDSITDAIAGALTDSRVTHVVALSSFGADKLDGTGPVVGTHYLEEKLKSMPNVNALLLRPGYFMENTLPQIGIIKSIGVVAGPLRPELELPLIATRDIGDYVADALLGRGFSGHSTRELQGQRDISMAEAAGIIGRAISRPHLAYVRPSNAQVRTSLLEMGMSENMVALFLEMSEALNSGHMAALEKRSSENTTPTSYETFVKEVFAPEFLGKKASA